MLTVRDGLVGLLSVFPLARSTNNSLGAQRISRLGRIYPATTGAQQGLLVSGMVLCHYKVVVRDKNPFLVTPFSDSDTDSREREKEKPVTQSQCEYCISDAVR
jgi:hypothetical protein